ncbi:GATA-type zinc finger protein 1 isoform X2 [Microcaecilia unicolor]|nr:GATA-type zinc finger protein 1 isoform X2 [Microcaecilia unicolor]
MEAPVFAEGPEPPDFSLLRELLFPPCLEPDPPPPGLQEEEVETLQLQQEERVQRAADPEERETSGHAAARGCAGSRPRATRGRSWSPRPPRACSARAGRQGQRQEQQRGRGMKGRGSERRSAFDQTAAMDPLRSFSMSCSLQAPDPSVLFFLQESAKLLPKPELDAEDSKAAGQAVSSSPGTSESHVFKMDYSLLPMCSKLTCSCPQQSHPQAFSLLPTMHCFSAMDALNLISIQCTDLVNSRSLMGNHSRMSTTEAMPEGDLPVMMETSEDDLDMSLTERLMLHHKSIGTSGEEMRSSPAATALQGKDGVAVPNDTSLTSIGCAKMPRKQKRPTKGAAPRDPTFEGVWFQMRLRFGEGDYGNCHLLTTFQYSVRCWKRSHRSKSGQIRSTNDTIRPNSFEEAQGAFCALRNKCCASCRTEKTPLWRDAEDGTPLCNACGIRYKKYGIRCFKCWNIPKKEGKACSKCSNCGGRLHVSLSKCKAGK